MTVICPDCDCAVPYHSSDCPSRPYALDRNAIIEECAKVVERAIPFGIKEAKLAAAIRALKDKQ